MRARTVGMHVCMNACMYACIYVRVWQVFAGGFALLPSLRHGPIAADLLSCRVANKCVYVCARA